MMKTIILSLTAIALASCAPTLSSAQKAKIQSVSITTPEIKKDAYHEPQGGSDTARAAAGSVGVIGGAIGGLVGGLIGEGIYSAQHSSFKNEHGQSFDSIKTKVPQALQSALKNEITQQVKANSFFVGKVKSQSAYQFKSQILAHGLRRVGKDSNGQILLAPAITADIYLLAPNGKKWIHPRPPVSGTSSQSAPLSAYLKNPKKIEQGYANAIKQLGVAFSKALKKGAKTK